MNELVFPGITPEPISGYLKGLGVLRLVSEQVDPSARGWWSKGVFHFLTNLNKDEILAFFLNKYSPTPILNPWSKGSGFYSKDNTKAISGLRESENPRLAAFKKVIPILQDILSSVRAKHAGLKDLELKQILLAEIRRKAPDEFLVWLDAVVVLLEDGQAYPPLFGTGGNDGRLDFSQNFMQRLIGLGLHLPSPGKEAQNLLDQSLFGTPVKGLGKEAVGQFNPGRAGGPNSTQGMEGDAGDNPWDFILQFEGGVLFAAGITRKLNHARSNKAHMPFTVDPSGVDGTMVRTEAGSARGEIWLPLWKRPAGLREISALLAEGRAEIGRQRASTGLDLARAISGLGIDRGVSAFCRMGILNRNGKAFLVTPLGQFPVRHQPLVDRLRELDSWLQSFTYAAKAKGAPARFGILLNQLESSLLNFAKQAEPRRLADVLAALGRCFLGMANSLKFCKEVHRGLLPDLGPDWLTDADDGTPEFRLGRALASIHESKIPTGGKSSIGPLACNLLPVQTQGDRLAWSNPPSPSCVMGSGSLSLLLAKALHRRLIDSIRMGQTTLPVHSGKPQRKLTRPACPVSPEDLNLFLQGEVDDSRLFDLLHGLVAIRGTKIPATHSGGSDIPRAFALLKPHFNPFKFKIRGVDIPPKPFPEWLVLLLAERGSEAVVQGARRLRNLGLCPLPHRRGRFAEEEFLMDGGIPGSRLAAGLLFPLDDFILVRMTERVTRDTAEVSL